jgi:hypothetical protein
MSQLTKEAIIAAMRRYREKWSGTGMLSSDTFIEHMEAWLSEHAQPQCNCEEYANEHICIPFKQEPTDGIAAAERSVIEAAEAWDEELPDYMYSDLVVDGSIDGQPFKAMDDLVTARALRLSGAVKALKAARGDQE